jgi:hypothetical protein
MFHMIHELCLRCNVQVEFHTSSLRGAGTDANVYFQLSGENGDSEVQRVVAGQEAFERGGVDTYTYRHARLDGL